MHASHMREPSINAMVMIIRSRYSQRTLHWRNNDHDGISNHRRLGYLRDCFFRHRSKKTSKLRDTRLCVGNSPVSGEFHTQRASIAENVFIWWRHHFPVTSLSILQLPVDTWWSVNVFRITSILCAANPPVIFPDKGPVMQRFGVFFVVSQNKLLDK